MGHFDHQFAAKPLPASLKWTHKHIVVAVGILVVINLVWLFYQFQPGFEPVYINLPEGLRRPNLVLVDNETKGLSDITNNAVFQKVIPFHKLFYSFDSLATQHLPSNLPVPGDLVLVQANPWILDTLRKTDYRLAQASGRFVEDLDQEVILPRGATLYIPDSLTAHQIAESLLATRVDVQLSDFRLRLIRNNDTILNCPVRVGRNEEIYLEAVGRNVDLRTPTGNGKIIRVWRRPKSVNLHTGETYIVTRRDDGRITRMPAIPSLEPEINGRRPGKMIHATTNPITLGTAYSHGCIGVSEADMWVIYFNVPVGSTIVIRK